jgi:SAM-dependent methyltransferase
MKELESPEKIKQAVKEKYSNIARSSSTCCGDDSDLIKVNDNYEQLKGYNKDADLQLGCGVPTEFAGIMEGNVVVDLGAGAGNDVFVSRALVGESGKVIGIDFSEEMLLKAFKNLSKTGFKNIDFKLGEIEDLPIEEKTADVVISNCVLNLVPDKEEAFTEIYRILKDNGHFCVSDIVVEGDMPEEIRKDASLYVGCISGAIQKNEYISIIEKVGFKNIEIKRSKTNTIPDEILDKHLDINEKDKLLNSGFGIYSITVVGYK